MIRVSSTVSVHCSENPGAMSATTCAAKRTPSSVTAPTTAVMRPRTRLPSRKASAAPRFRW